MNQVEMATSSVSPFDFVTPLRRSWRHFIPIWLAPIGLLFGDRFSSQLPFLGPLSIAAFVLGWALCMTLIFVRRIGVLPFFTYSTAAPISIWYLLSSAARLFGAST
jgi:hypothetical protein